MTLGPPQLPYVSNVTGSWVRAEEATDPEYWVRHLRSAVRFADGVATVLAEPRAIIELGPGSQLASLIRQHPARTTAAAIVTSLRHAKETDDDQRTLLDAVGRLWTVGVPVDWAGVFDGETPTAHAAADLPVRARPALDRTTARLRAGRDARNRRSCVRTTSTSWLGRGRWVGRPGAVAAGEPRVWLAFAGQDPLAGAVVDGLRAAGRRVVVVRPGRDFAVVSATEYVLRPEEPDDYQAVLEAVADQRVAVGRRARVGARVRRLATPRPNGSRPPGASGSVRAWRWSRACRPTGLGEQALVWFLGAGFESVADEPVLTPAAATLRGLALVAPAESPGLRAGTIDIGPAAQASNVVATLVGEVPAGRPTSRLALRGGDLFEHEIEMAPPAAAPGIGGTARRGDVSHHRRPWRRGPHLRALPGARVPRAVSAWCRGAA